MIKKYSKQAAFCALAAVAMLDQVYALDLVGDYHKALSYDPTYQSALADKRSADAGADQQWASYFPQASYNNQRLPSDLGNRRTLSATQPIIDIPNWSNMMQSKPRRAFAEANLVAKRQDLALRLLKGIDAIIIANENLKLNATKIDALNRQSEQAKRLLAAGQGTVTDLRDVEVKAAQARAQQLLLQSQLVVASKQYAAMTGEPPVVSEFVLPQSQGKVLVRDLQDYVSGLMTQNPQLVASRASLQVAEWDLTRAKGQLAPTLSLIHLHSVNSATATSPESTSSYSGLQWSMPLGVQPFYGLKSSVASLEKNKEDLRNAEQNARVEVERLRELVLVGTQTLEIQKDAIAAAELSVEANTKSYQGGVRSSLDVLNSIQTLFQVKSDYANAVVQQAENLLQLLNLTDANVNDVFDEVSRFLLVH